MIKIALDPGHFGGTLSVLEDRHFVFSANEPVKEGDLNLKVSLLLKQMLEEAGIKVLLSRGSYKNFKTGLKFTLKDFQNFKLQNWNKRVLKINKFKPDLTIAIHFNSNCYSSNIVKTEVNGVMTFIYSKDKELVKWAKIVSKNLSADFKLPFCEKKWFLKDVALLWEDLGNGVNFRELFILKNVKSPIVLTEGPLMNNLEVYRSLISDDSLQVVYARSLFKSIKEVFLV